MSVKPLVSAVATLAIALLASTATAQTTEHQVLGWTASGLLVMHVTERGERMVDGMSKDYYVEATQVWGATEKPTLFKHGEPRGPAPDRFSNAQDQAVGDKYRDGLIDDTPAASNATGTRHFAWHARRRIDRPDERSYICKIGFRVVVLDDAAKRVYTLFEGEAEGELSRRQDEALCPNLRVSPHWANQGGDGFVLLAVGEKLHGQFANTRTLEAAPWASYTPSAPLIATLAAAEAEAWTAAEEGRFSEAATAFEASGSGGGKALVAALSGEKKATKAADAAFDSSGKTGRDTILRAAAYIAAGNNGKATAWIDTAVAGATSYDELLEFAAIFELVDPAIANQLAVHALSHPTATGEKTATGWTFLARGLLDVGEYSKAEEALAKVDNPTPESLAALATLYTDKRQLKQANTFAEDLLFNNPGDCRAYLVAGRLRAAEGDNVDARALIDAALSCDPALEEAAFFAADYARLSGDVAAAKDGFARFLSVAPPRGSDQIRAARRAVAEQWKRRLDHNGVVVTDLSCRKGGAGYLCTGTLKNTTTKPSGEVVVEAIDRRKAVGNATIADIAPGNTAPFGLSFSAKKLDDVKLTAGRDKKERKRNETPAR